MFFVCFLVAEVLSVSRVAVEGRAVVMAVSRWPASVAAVVSLVSTSPCRRVLCAKKFAQRAENTPILVFLGLLGEFFRGSAAGGAALGDFSCGLNRGGAALGEFFRAYRHRGQVIQVTWYLHAGNSGGFALHEALWGRVAGVSDPHVVQIPRLVGECEGCGAHSADHLGE